MKTNQLKNIALELVTLKNNMRYSKTNKERGGNYKRLADLLNAGRDLTMGENDERSQAFRAAFDNIEKLTDIEAMKNYNILNKNKFKQSLKQLEASQNLESIFKRG